MIIESSSNEVIKMIISSYLPIIVQFGINICYYIILLYYYLRFITGTIFVENQENIESNE